MIRVNANCITGIAMESYPKEAGLVWQVLHVIPSGAKVAFVDLPPTYSIMSLAIMLHVNGRSMEAYIDHHKDPRNSEELENIGILKRRFGEKVRIVERSSARTCFELVQPQEWKKRGVSAVLFGNDLDGFFSFLQGCGVTYKSMRHDGVKMDVSSWGKRKPSWVARLLADCFYITPEHGDDPEAIDLLQQEIFQTVIDWIISEFRQGIIEDLKQKAQEAKQRAWVNAMEVFKYTEPLPGGVAFVDLCEVPLPYPRTPIATFVWKALVLKNFGNVLMGVRSGNRVSIETSQEMGEVDLRDYMPEGERPGHVPFRAVIRWKHWNKFLTKWRQRQDS